MGNNAQTSGWSKVLKNKRKQLGETQAEFGKRFDVSYVAISLWENGERGIPDNVTWWLAENLPRVDESGNLLLPCTDNCINYPHLGLDRNGGSQ